MIPALEQTRLVFSAMLSKGETVVYEVSGNHVPVVSVSLEGATQELGERIGQCSKERNDTRQKSV